MLTMHPQFIGRPSRIAMLEQLLDFVQGHHEVWITTACEAERQARWSMDADAG